MALMPDDAPQPDAAAIERAIHEPGVLRTFFQPIVDVSRGVVAGYEALTRFLGPPAATPDRWFVAAEAAGLHEPLEARAIALALTARDALPANCFLTVNVGPAAMCSPSVARVLADAGDLRGVVLELTEHSPVGDYDALLAALEPARRAGALVAVDDAGSGFASLRHITTLRPQFVKVDRELVAGVDRDEVKVAVLETLGLVASRLDAWIVAEGIETMAELDRVASLGVPLAQGYALGRPAPVMDASSAELAEAQARADARERGGALAALAEVAARLPAADGHAAAAALLLAEPSLAHVVLVDEHDRPVRLVGRHAATEPLVVGADRELGEIARRAMTRPEPARFDPVLLCDARGRLAGLVRIERLVQALAGRLAA